MRRTEVIIHERLHNLLHRLDYDSPLWRKLLNVLEPERPDAQRQDSWAVSQKTATRRHLEHVDVLGLVEDLQHHLLLLLNGQAPFLALCTHTSKATSLHI